MGIVYALIMDIATSAKKRKQQQKKHISLRIRVNVRRTHRINQDCNGLI